VEFEVQGCKKYFVSNELKSPKNIQNSHQYKSRYDSTYVHDIKTNKSRVCEFKRNFIVTT
jgi:hypothetical protein